MRDRQTIVGGALFGALLGAAAGYLFFTARGRRFRRDIEPEMQILVREAMRIGKTVTDLRQSRSPAPRVAATSPLAWPRRT